MKRQWRDNEGSGNEGSRERRHGVKSGACHVKNVSSVSLSLSSHSEKGTYAIIYLICRAYMKNDKHRKRRLYITRNGKQWRIIWRENSSMAAKITTKRKTSREKKKIEKEKYHRLLKYNMTAMASKTLWQK